MPHILLPVLSLLSSFNSLHFSLWPTHVPCKGKVSTPFPNYFLFLYLPAKSSPTAFCNTACCLDQSFQSILNIRKRRWPFAVWTLWTVWCIVKKNQPPLLFNLFTPSIMKYWVDSDKVQLTERHLQLVIFIQKPGPTKKAPDCILTPQLICLHFFLVSERCNLDRTTSGLFEPFCYLFCMTQLATDLSVLKACVSNHASFAGLSLR